MNRGEKDFTGYFVNALIALLLAVIYTLTASYLFPEGISWVFVERLWKRLILLVPFIVLGLTLYLYIFKNKTFSYSKGFEKIERYDWFFAAIPMIPIFRYVLANQDWLNIGNTILVLLLFAVVSVLFCVIIPSLLSLFATKHLLMALSTSILFAILNMASLTAYYSWHMQGDLYIQLAVLAVIFLLLALSKFLPRQLIILIIGFVFTANIIIAFTELNTARVDNTELEDLIVVKKLRNMEIKRSNDVLLLVYEAYANYETLLHYGYDNSDQLSFLENNGFHIYHGIYTVATPTTAAMSKVFNLDPSLNNTKYPAGGGAVQTLLRESGYESYSIFQDDYYFRGLKKDQIVCKNHFPPLRNEALTIIEAIIKGEFSDEISLEGIGYETYIERKHTVLEGRYISPFFMYSHSNYPGHGPSGMGVDPEESQNQMNRYIRDLIKISNDEMRQDIRLAIDNNHEAIIVIAGDHGPFLTKDGYGLNRRGNFEAKDVDRYDIQDRFGAFLAIRWPDLEYAYIHNIEILQDIFPAVFAYLYNDEELFDKIKMERAILNSDRTLGVTVENGIIIGGKNDGEPLFLYDGN